MENFNTEQISAIETIVARYIEHNPELILKRILGVKTLDVQTKKVLMTCTEDGVGVGKVVFKRVDE